MNRSRFFIILAGITAFIGIIIIQVGWLRQAAEEEQRKFSQTIQVALMEVANGINHYYGYTTPHVNPVQKQSEDYYLVNMRNDFEAEVLELLLVNTFRAKGISTPFEYAIYDCETDDMLYGSYVEPGRQAPAANNTLFPKVSNLVYYFAVRIPGHSGIIYHSLRGWIIVCAVMVVILCIYGYALYIIRQQQRYADLQKDFINNMTHEFKTPLSSILIASGFMAREPVIQENEKLQQYTRIITEQGKKLDQHLETLLHIARSDRYRMKLQLQPVAVTDILQNAVRIIRLKYPLAQLKLDNRIGEVTVQADPFHFANILYNLLDNAAKYSHGQPEIWMELFTESGKPVIRITDRGAGIAPKSLKHIFDKFYRAPEHRNMAVSGFGLGLYYVKKVAELHSWQLTASSTPGKGTAMTLRMN
jgi:two-component system phosphate regulon sensor histidine kinase PhoR